MRGGTNETAAAVAAPAAVMQTEKREQCREKKSPLDLFILELIPFSVCACGMLSAPTHQE